MLTFCTNIVQWSAQLSNPTIMTSLYKPSVPVTEKAKVRHTGRKKELYMAAKKNKVKAKSRGDSVIKPKNDKTLLQNC